MQKIVFLLIVLFQLTQSVSIEEFGAIHNDDSYEATIKNQIAITNAFNSVLLKTEGDREILIEANKTYTILPIVLENFHNFTLRVEGTLLGSTNMSAYDVYLAKSEDNSIQSNKRQAYQCRELFQINQSSDFKITGNGVIDGQGYDWWVREFHQTNICLRPHMFLIYQSSNFTIENLHLRNSARFHLLLTDVKDVVINGIDIFVDIESEKPGSLSHRLMSATFPLNTDGIDPSGRNIYISNVTITNFDDAIAVKPSNRKDIMSQCSENMIIENSKIYFSVGLSIGSVPPNNDFNCVRNITFRNVEMFEPIKSIYIKTNPGDEGSGVIENILYENITSNNAFWWNIYIGPQQQKQPDGLGPGCMFYPFDRNCDTQPRVTVQNITLRNIQSSNGLLYPGLIRCNVQNPCKNIIFDNVKYTGLLQQQGWFCENAEIQQLQVSPEIQCSRYPVNSFQKFLQLK